MLHSVPPGRARHDDRIGRRRASPAVPLSQRVGGLISRAGILIPFLIAFAVLAIISPPFLKTANLTNILDQQAGIIIVACAGTFVLIAGGIDLSIGAIYGLAAAVSLQVASNVGSRRRGSWPASRWGSPSASRTASSSPSSGSIRSSGRWP